tara:strand:- start:990 stop:1472 length:483 start_codon:yes stop_codon:yes gene_type:complete
MMKRYFDLLECDKKTPLKEIKKNFIKLMKKTHPDRGHDDKLCKKINEAYQKILDYKLDNIIDVSNSLMPIKFREMGFDTMPTPGQYIRRQIELSNKLINDSDNDTDDDTGDDTDDDTGDDTGDDIKNNYKKNLLTSELIFQIENNKEEKNIFQTIFDFFF